MTSPKIKPRRGRGKLGEGSNVKEGHFIIWLLFRV